MLPLDGKWSVCSLAQPETGMAQHTVSITTTDGRVYP